MKTSDDAFSALLAANPFAEASEAEPNRVMLLLSKRPPAAIWIHYASGVGSSKLTPALIDKACGAPTTARNVRTIAKLAELAARL